MKICLYAQGRSGSTSLYNLILNHLPIDYKSYDEPFNNFLNKKFGINNFNILNEINKNQNIIIKTLHYNTINDMNEEQMIDMLIKKFDKNIFLIRMDIVSQSESFLYRSKSNPYDWHMPDVYDISIISEKELNERICDYAYSNNFLIKYCYSNGYPIYTYEDIFVKKDINVIKEIFNYLEIDLNYEIYNEWVLNPNKKERLI